MHFLWYTCLFFVCKWASVRESKTKSRSCVERHDQYCSTQIDSDHACLVVGWGMEGSHRCARGAGTISSHDDGRRDGEFSQENSVAFARHILWPQGAGTSYWIILFTILTIMKYKNYIIYHDEGMVGVFRWCLWKFSLWSMLHDHVDIIFRSAIQIACLSHVFSEDVGSESCPPMEERWWQRSLACQSCQNVQVSGDSFQRALAVISNLMTVRDPILAVPASVVVLVDAAWEQRVQLGSDWSPTPKGPMIWFWTLWLSEISWIFPAPKFFHVQAYCVRQTKAMNSRQKLRSNSNSWHSIAKRSWSNI